jgi:hypothetical protein
MKFLRAGGTVLHGIIKSITVKMEKYRTKMYT